MPRAPSLLLLVLALAVPASPRAEEPEAAHPPPQGAPADVALWQRGQAAGEAVVGARAEAGRLQQRVRTERLLERLEAAAAAATPEAAARLRALRRELQEEWSADYEVISRRWPVDPTRVCWYPMLAFETALGSAGGPAAAEPPRRELQDCVARAELAVRGLVEANHELREAVEAAARALAGPAAP